MVFEIMRVSRRLLHHSQLEGVAMVRGARNCFRGLMTSRHVAVQTVGTQQSEIFVASSWNDSDVFRRAILGPLLAWKAVRSCATNGENWSQARQHNAPFGGRALRINSRNSMSAEKCRSMPGKRVKAKQFSTLLVQDDNIAEPFSTETLGSVRESTIMETGSSLQEFGPEFEQIGPQPLAQDIQWAPSEQLSPAGDHSESNASSLSDIPASSPRVYDTDREVQQGRVYVGGLPFSVKGDALRDRLRELCGKYGSVMEVTLAQHRHQSQKSIMMGKHRGFAFVTMENQEQAMEVVDKLNGTEAWDRNIMVSYGLKKYESETDGQDPPSKNNPRIERKKVFVGNLKEDTSRADLVDRFKEYGTIEDVKLITELHSGRSRGFGFVTFAKEVQAMKAILDLDGSTLDGSVIRVNIAKYPQGY